MKIMIEVANCPVCGKPPKIRFDEASYYTDIDALFCTIRCKPFLRKPHLEKTSNLKRTDGFYNSLKRAVNRWNKAVEKYNMEENK